uniref:PHD-type domain-containing protein n=1 Tax=Parastrongyloides trichosuri TaxID=131310 RepID=A0A0N5A544_PARTI
MVKTRTLSAKQPTLKVNNKRKRADYPLPLKRAKKLCDTKNNNEDNTDIRKLRNHSRGEKKLHIDCSLINPNSPSSRENITPSPIPKEIPKLLDTRKITKLQSIKDPCTPNNFLGVTSFQNGLSSVRRQTISTTVGSRKHVAEVFDGHIVSEMRRRPVYQGGSTIKSIPLSDKWKIRWDTGVQIPFGDINYSYDAKLEKLLPKINSKNEIPEGFEKRICTYDKAYINNNFKKLNDPVHLEYNLDSEDINWFNSIMDNNKFEDVNIDMMSKCLNFMEERCYVESRIKLLKPIIHPAPSVCDEGEICEVCRDHTSNENDEIAFCDRCDKGFHQQCYGIPDTKEMFLCNPCLLLLDEIPRCIVCPVQGGALKILDNGYDFCHINCARYIKELNFGDDETLEPITGIMNIFDTGNLSKCSICDIDYGHTIKCSNKNCEVYFHVECGKRADLYMNIESNPDKEDEITTLCESHTMVLKNIIKKNINLKNKKTYDEANNMISNYIKNNDITRVSTANLSFLNYITLPLLEQHFVEYNKSFLRSLYEYWKIKKIDNNCKTLLKVSNSQLTYNVKSKSWEKSDALYDIHKEEPKGRLHRGYLGFLTNSYKNYSEYKSSINAKSNLCDLIEKIELSKRSLDEEKFSLLEKMKPQTTFSAPSENFSKKSIIITTKGNRHSARLNEKNKIGIPKYSPKATFDELYENGKSVSKSNLLSSKDFIKSSNDHENTIESKRVSSRLMNNTKRNLRNVHQLSLSPKRPRLSDSKTRSFFNGLAQFARRVISSVN